MKDVKTEAQKGYDEGWNACLTQVRQSLKDLVEGEAGVDTVVLENVHRIVAKASKVHEWEPVGPTGTFEVAPDMICTLCGQGRDADIHGAR